MTASTTAPDRAEISRRNGCKSQGPRSPEGKARSRMNALKHGMTARIPLLPGEDEAAFRRQVDGLIEALDPRDAVEIALAEQAALALWKIERAERAEAARVAAALRAEDAVAGLEKRDEIAAMGHWLLTDNLRARQNAAASLFPFLSEDRKDPFRRGRGDPRHVVLRLEATADGCRWLLAQWTRLRERLERGHEWRTDEMILALQLRGQRPLGLDVLEWQDLLEPISTEGNAALIAQARRQLLHQLEEGLPGDPVDRRAALLRLVQEEASRLDQREAEHHRRESADRAERVDRLAVDTAPEGERMRRYQLDFDRKLHRAINGLLKLRRAEGVGVAGDPAPDRTLGTEPEPARTVEPRGGPEGEADAEVPPEADGGGPEDDDRLAVSLPASSSLDPSSDLNPEVLVPAAAVAAPDPDSAAVAAPGRPTAEPEGHPVPRDEPGPTADGDLISRIMSVIRCAAASVDPSPGRNRATGARAGTNDLAAAVPAPAGPMVAIPPGGETPASGGGEGAPPDPRDQPIRQDEPFTPARSILMEDRRSA